MVGGYPATLAVSNNDLVLTVVPEPATVTLLGSALLGLGVVYLRRRWAKTIAGLVLAAALLSPPCLPRPTCSTWAARKIQRPGVYGRAWRACRFVPVGNASNESDPATGFGEVSYNYGSSE